MSRGALQDTSGARHRHRGVSGNDCSTIASQRAFCAFCQDRIWGLGRQGFKCIQCKLLVHKKCHKVVRKPCLSLQQQQQQQQSAESQTIDRNGDQQLDSFPCVTATSHLEDEITESPIMEEHPRDRKRTSRYTRPSTGGSEMRFTSETMHQRKLAISQADVAATFLFVSLVFTKVYGDLSIPGCEFGRNLFRHSAVFEKSAEI